MHIDYTELLTATTETIYMVLVATCVAVGFGILFGFVD